MLEQRGNEVVATDVFTGDHFAASALLGVGAPERRPSQVTFSTPERASDAVKDLHRYERAIMMPRTPVTHDPAKRSVFLDEFT